MTDVWAYLRSLSQEELAARLDQMPLAEQQELLALLEREKAQDLRAKVLLPPLYPLQQEIKDKAARFNVICIGRRAGKTYLCTHLALETALQGHPVGWFVPDYKTALEVWRDLIRPIKQIATKINATERRIELPNGGVIEVWTLENEDAGRGRKYKRVIVDEAAMAPRLQIAWEQAISPTLTDLKGDAWFPSTPKGLNYYHALYGFGLDPARPDWKAWQLPSTVNPFLPAEEIARQREMLPQQAFQQEYLAEFITSDGAVFRNVDACCIHKPDTPQNHYGHLTVAGVDWGQQHDFTVISVFCVSCNREVVLDRFNQIGWGLQRGRLAQHAATWGVKAIVVESNSIGGPNLEQLHKDIGDKHRVQGFEMTARTKPDLIQQMALSLEKRSAEWLDDPVARFEMVAYEAKKTEAGYTKYSAPEGGWDDCVIARCLALEAKRLNPIALLTITEQANIAMPHTWRDQYIYHQDPVTQQQLLDAREEEYRAARERIEQKRRPKLSHSDVLGGGGIADIWG